jgi:hypothetical protein
MRISELLNENELPRKPKKPTSNLQSAASINDEPEDELDNDVEDGDDGGSSDDIKSIGGDLGRDLYSVTVYNTGDDFADISQVTSHTWKLENFKSPVIKSYLSQSNHDISNEKTISCVIFNSRNGEFFRFNSGESGGGFEPDLNQLVSGGMIDPDQLNVLRDIDSVGKKYAAALANVDWKAGNTAEGRGASQMYNVLSRLKDALNLREPVERIHDVHISDEQRAKNAEYSKGAKERVKAKMDAWKAARKAAGAGRDMR